MNKPLVYVASSWRNDRQQQVVAALRELHFEVYDFKNPEPGCQGFSWSEIDPKWEQWTTTQYKQGLKHPVAQEGFLRDFKALSSCQLCVLVLPCNRSAHLEAGHALGQRIPTFILIEEKQEPELMYLMAHEHNIFSSLDDLLDQASTYFRLTGYPVKKYVRKRGTRTLTNAESSVETQA